ncbi:MAG: class I SAM-dependent methyltransferase [Betaproteobacteria bacterium]|nr:class I SAM-dependent methyltransferase [Betaproteobacteria bacterium]
MTSFQRSDFGEWPTHGLERVPACPLCGGGKRSILHAGLRDHAFRTAPGEWVLQRCEDCGCAYLDPRPDAATIARAYERYYTHGNEGGPTESDFARLRRRVAEAYLNARYGMSYPNAFPGGQHIARLFPRRRAYLDVSYARHLGPATGDNRLLLDVGCGNGAFLQFAAHLGWTAEGIDNDAAAVAAAHAAGCRVSHGSLDELPFGAGRYRHLTLSHVIEHVHEPLKLLRQCFELLAPGGRLWLQTPNLRSFGHDVFGPAWRGLEPPRHLVLFDRASLTAALAGTGFSGIEFRAHPGVTVFMWEQSRMIARASGRSARGMRRKLLSFALGVHVAELCEALRPDEREFLTCVAFRPEREEPAGA